MSASKPPKTPSKGTAPRVPLDPSHVSESRSLDAFIDAANRAPAPTARDTHRLVFALDATASRQPTWDLACELHAELFNEADRLGNVAIQLCYYRGHREFHASRWATTPGALRGQMLGVTCRGGMTQLTRLLSHAAEEAGAHPLRAVIFVGDCFEESEDAMLAAGAQLALRNVPVLIFQEGRDPTARRAFGALARLTRGALLPFTPGSSAQLRDLLGAAVRYAVGGREALEQHARLGKGEAARGLLSQLPKR